MDQFSLKRGNARIHLTKSEQLIGLRTLAEHEVLTASRFAPEMDVVETGDYLAGFQLLEVHSPDGAEKVLDRLRELNPSKTGSHIYHTSRGGASYAPTGKITIRFQPGTTESDVKALMNSFELQLIERRPPRNRPDALETFVYSVTPASPNPLKIADVLQQHPLIVIAEPDLSTSGHLSGFIMPSDQYLKEQWHLQNSGVQFGQMVGLKKGADARVVEAWREAGFGSPECIIAIIDDGYDLTHPDLSDATRIVAPWDFESATTDPSPRNFLPHPGNIHGTACAGLALGSAKGECIAGVAPGCGFMPLRWSRNLNDDSIRSWFSYAQSKGAWIISCSWGGPPGDYILSTIQTEAIEDCTTLGRNGLGCVVIFAAGDNPEDINDTVNGIINGFAIHADVIAVASSNSLDQRSSFSSFGKEIAVCAPSNGRGGVGIVTANVSGTVMNDTGQIPRGYADIDQNFTTDFGGTSAAAPLVAGVCALVLSVAPSLSAAEVKKVLISSARKIGGGHAYTDGHSVYFGYGCVNALEAVRLAKKQTKQKP